MKSDFSTITLVDQVERGISEYIKENHLIPGDHLPNEIQISEMMGISRNVVREALSRFRMLGMIQTRTRRGIVVTEPQLLSGFSKVLDPNLLSIKSIKEMMGMRIVLETGIAEFLFENLTESDISDLEAIVSRQQSIGINNMSVEDETAFHAKIYEIAGNDFILQFAKLMHPIFLFSKENYESYFLPINRRLSENGELVRHSDLMEFIKNKDKNGYREAMRKHLQPYWEFLYNYDL